MSKDTFTPLMQQYYTIKENYKDTILFFRLGDFYEMFGDDAVKASPVLGIVLTKRQTVPMCGVPFHSVSNYLAKLIKKGFKVAICEQMEDPAQAKGIIKRDVVRVITPGTILEENLLDTKKNNYLLSLFPKVNDKETIIGISYIDISTGDFFVSEINDDESLLKLSCELTRINPSEYVIPESLKNSALLKKINPLKNNNNIINYTEDYFFEYNYSREKICSAYKIDSLKSTGFIEKKQLGINSCGALLAYIEQTQKSFMPTLKPIKYYSTDEYMLLDDSAIRNLELIQGSLTKTTENSLLEVLDKTSTTMGSRLLRKIILQPLTNVDIIKQRQNTVKFFVEEGIVRRQLKELLKSVCDIERVLSRNSTGLINPRDIDTLKNTLELIPKIKSTLKSTTGLDIKQYVPDIKLDNLHEMAGLISLIKQILIEEPTQDISKGGFIKKGYNSELDELQTISTSGKSYIAEMELKEKQKTGINSLKIGYTSVFGYYIEVTKSNLPSVPPEYIRKQTLVNCERFITQELKEYEQKVLSAEEKIIRIEHEIFENLKKEVAKEKEKLYLISEAISELDVFLTFAEVAVINNFCLPEINYDYSIDIKDCRHPVIEKKLINKSFVPNDILLNGGAQQIIILTGPNMAGKSTYLRQLALTVILAQAGSYVPAKSAVIGIIDRIFTRIGAADNLAGGESTFMVEMHEAANILNNATNRSLLILDEVGRGTSTFDGISIAWATVEYLHKMKFDNIGPKVMFATHYFELTELAEKLDGVKNYNVSVREWQDDVIFLHKIIPGFSDRSYGIHVAKLAGLPKELISRAKQILKELESQSHTESDKLLVAELDNNNQLDFFSTQKSHPIQSELELIDVDNIKPVEALKILNEWKGKYGKRT